MRKERLGETLYTAEEMKETLQEIAGRYPHMAQYISEGYSQEKRPIASIRIGYGTKTLICTAGIHGRESINPTVLVKMTKEYCETYTNTYGVFGKISQKSEKWKRNGRRMRPRIALLQDYRILMLPLLNPDGYEIACPCGYNATENGNVTWKYNAAGIDINRDFPSCSYRAQKSSKKPFSAVESRILANVFQREDSVGYLDFHSRGKEIYWYRSAMGKRYNDRQRMYASALCSVSGYRMGRKEDEQKDVFSGGNTVQYYSERYARPAITVETVAEEARFPLNGALVETTYYEIKDIPLEYLDVCARYQCRR